MGLQCCIWNHSRILLIYGSYDKDNNFFEWSLEILTPRMYTDSLMSFILKFNDNHPLISLTYTLLFPTISISSTYSNKIINLSLKPFYIYAMIFINHNKIIWCDHFMKINIPLFWRLLKPYIEFKSLPTLFS